jgi:predicted transcriptional regulator
MARPAEAPLNYLGGKKKLSATEFEFMKFIWKHPEGVSSEEISGISTSKRYKKYDFVSSF